jgi:predicted RNA polymerase sigma factor
MLRVKTGVLSYAPELHRLRGELLWRLGREEQARESFQVALALAQPERMEGYARRARASLAALEGEREHAGR